jgi:hypothetical protein
VKEINELLNVIEKKQFIDLEISFSLAKKCSELLRDKKTETAARKIIIYILDNWEKVDEETKEIWVDLVESAGFYPYLDKVSNPTKYNTVNEIRKFSHESENLRGKFFHEEQNLVLSLLNTEGNVIVSAPTSFGKSLLIEEIVASKKYRNIVIIQPTLALLDETRLKLKKYTDDYKLIVRTSQTPSINKGNLFLLTAERVMEYKAFPSVDFLVLDEFYKLSTKRDDERSDTLNNAFNLIVNKHNAKFYLLGPNVDKISPGFSEKYNASFFKTDYSLVENKVVDIYTQHKDQFGSRGRKAEFKEKKLFELLYKLRGEQTIIYCSSPSRVRNLSRKFNEYLIEKKLETVINYSSLPLIEWAEKYIGKDWGLIRCLKNGIGIHDGALQKHITSTIIKYFNEVKLSYLFCTSTIIEGVNTSAKNVIFFDSTKGMKKKIDYFDYCNIKGRSGRLMVHFTGKIYNFNPVPDKELIEIDIPFYEQNPVSDEVPIHIREEDVRNPDSKQYQDILDIPADQKEIFKKNGVSIKGQQQIIKILEKEIVTNNRKINWTRYPDYNQLKYILNLAWDNLLKEGETTRPMTQNKLVKVTFDYGINQDIEYLVNSNYLYYKKQKDYQGISDQRIKDDAILNAFQILKHWFQYKVPKWLNVINNLQIYVSEKYKLKPGDYSFYANQIENDFIRTNLSILNEYGIPKSAIGKLAKKIPDDLSEDSVINYINKENLLKSSDFLSYEREKIRENF